MTPEIRYADWRLASDRRLNPRWVGIGVALLTVGPICFYFNRLGSAPISFGVLVAQLVSVRLVDWQMRKLRDGAESGQLAAALRLSREVTYGYDEGLISFVDGWLVYTGRRCTFSLPASVVDGISIDQTRVLFNFGPEDDQRTISLSVVSNKEFLKEASAWKMAADVPADSVVLPPIVTEPSSLPALRPQAVLSVLSIAVSSVLLLTIHLSFGGFVASIGGLVVGLLLAGYTFERRRILRLLQSPHPAPRAFWGRPLSFSRRPKSLPADSLQ